MNKLNTPILLIILGGAVLTSILVYVSAQRATTGPPLAFSNEIIVQVAGGLSQSDIRSIATGAHATVLSHFSPELWLFEIQWARTAADVEQVRKSLSSNRHVLDSEIYDPQHPPPTVAPT